MGIQLVQRLMTNDTGTIFEEGDYVTLVMDNGNELHGNIYLILEDYFEFETGEETVDIDFDDVNSIIRIMG